MFMYDHNKINKEIMWVSTSVRMLDFYIHSRHCIVLEKLHPEKEIVDFFTNESHRKAIFLT